MQRSVDKSDKCIEWIVHGLDSARFRDFPGPLDRYEKPYELLPHLEAGSIHIGENTSERNESGKRGEDPEDSATSEVPCFAYGQIGHFAHDCSESCEKASSARISPNESTNASDNDVVYVVRQLKMNFCRCSKYCNMENRHK